MEKTAGVGTNVNARLAVKNPYNWCRCRRLIVDHCYNSSEREPGFLCDRSTVDTHRACSLGLAFPSPPAACPTLAGIPLQRSLWSFPPFFSLSRPGKKKKTLPSVCLLFFLCRHSRQLRSSHHGGNWTPAPALPQG